MPTIKKLQKFGMTSHPGQLSLAISTWLNRRVKMRNALHKISIYALKSHQNLRRKVTNESIIKIGTSIWACNFIQTIYLSPS